MATSNVINGKCQKPVTFKGEYVSTTTYSYLDIVTYDGCGWFCKATVVGVAPSQDSAYWELLAEKGDTGASGTDGVSIESVEQTTTTAESSGVNVVTVTLSDGTVSYFYITNGAQGEQGEQGEQGNSGYQGAAEELEVVNNLTDGGATAALSAEQGKTLKTMIDSVEDDVDALSALSERTYVTDADPITTFAQVFDDFYLLSDVCTNYDGIYKIYAISVSAGDDVLLHFIDIPNNLFGAVAFVDSLSKVVDGGSVDELIWGNQAAYTDESYRVTADGYLLVQGNESSQAYVSVHENTPVNEVVGDLFDKVGNIESRLENKTVFELGENTDNYAGGYNQNAVGIFSRTLAESDYVNSLQVRLLKAEVECDAQYKVYKRYTGAASTSRTNSTNLNLQTATLIGSGTIRLSDQYKTYNVSIPSTNIAAGEQVYFLVCGLPTASHVGFKGWSSVGDDDSVSNTVLLSTQATIEDVWANDFLFGIEGRYGAPSLSLYYKSEFMTRDDVEELVDEKLEGIATDDDSAATDIVINDTITAVVGDKLQIFYKSIFNVPNPDNFEMFCIGSVGKNYPRYYEIEPTADDVGVHTLTFHIGKCVDYSAAKPSIIKSRTISLNVVAEPSSGTKNILLVGDSTIVNGVFPKEVKRRFASTGGTPEGLGLTGINVCGRKTSTVDGLAVGWEGTGGWGWSTYTSAGTRAMRLVVSGVSSLSIGAKYIATNGTTLTIAEINVTSGSGNLRCTLANNATMPTAPFTLTKSSGSGDATISVSSYTEETYSPFYNDGAMDFTTYANAYCDGDIDIIVACLGINDIYGHQSESDISGTITSIINKVKTFARGFHTDFPNGKVALMTICRCSANGGMGANYGASWGATNLPYDRCAFALNKAYMELADDDEFASYLSVIDTSAEFDHINCYKTSETPVNTRISATEPLGTNGVHPLDEGLEMWADSIYREVCGVLND